MKNHKIRNIFLGLFGVVVSCQLSVVSSYAQESEKLVALSKQIMEAKDNREMYLAFEEVTDLFFQEHKYNDYIEFLKSFSSKKKSLGPVVSYYIALTRYYQLRHLEEMQSWDEYFSSGNLYRDQITENAKNAIAGISHNDALNVYAKLLVWKFHKDQNDNLMDESLGSLMNATLEYAKNTANSVPIKDVADQLSFYGEKSKAKELYKLYVTKLIAPDTKDNTLKENAERFYGEGNLELSEGVYDIYVERISKSLPKEKLMPVLIDIAKAFVYKDQGVKDPQYAERMFKKIAEIGGRKSLSEELIYLRAFNLERSKEYKAARDFYVDLVNNYPKDIHEEEANFKIGLISVYALRDILTGSKYFGVLAQKESVSPYVISSLYQLGLLSQWKEDLAKAKEYYNKLVEKSGSNFPDTAILVSQRLKEIEEVKPIEYNLKSFLDASLKEDFALFNMSKLDLRGSLYQLKKGLNTKIDAQVSTPQSGCMQIELEYLWSGHLGSAKPSASEISFETSFSQAGTKEINLVVVSPTGIIDRSFVMVDVSQ